ncbi:MAG: aminoacyl-tRNA hydrolase [Paludibacteraceae bacterium]|nr:aminoacyl-tRNA hydrolase [Paludibacteraceae bacterium]
MKYLIVGLGNIGDEYAETRHNIGFKVLDAFAKASNIVFDEGNRYGATATCRVKNAELFLLKPSTYMNESGKAVRYWLDKEKIDVNNLLIIVDDLSIPFGALRLKGNGSAGGHNGLKSVEAMTGTNAYSRLRFGIGNDFPKGMQIEYVLGEWTSEQKVALEKRIEVACEIIKSFCLAGLQNTMNQFNNK